MGSRVISLRLSREILERIDKLIELGAFRSRSEALRELIIAGLRNYEEMTRIAEAVKLLFEKEKEVSIRLDGALEELLKERR